MAGHSKFSTIKHRKKIQDQKKSIDFAKASKNIRLAVQLGKSTDTKMNYTLKNAIDIAKELNMPRDKIDASILSLNSNKELESHIIYGGHLRGVFLIIEVITSNRNRTFAFLKSMFKKAGGSTCAAESILHLFNKYGSIKVQSTAGVSEKLLEIEHVQDLSLIEEDKKKFFLYCDTVHLSLVLESILKLEGANILCKNITYKAKKIIDISVDDMGCIETLISTLEENEDIYCIHSNAF